MLSNYSLGSKFLNNHGQAVLWQAHYKSSDILEKIKSIGEASSSSIPLDLATPTLSSYRSKEFFTKPVQDTFSTWEFEDFEKQYLGQIEIALNTIEFLKKIGTPYGDRVAQMTETQYRDFFFHNSLAYLVSDIYAFFHKTNEQQAKNQKLFQDHRKDKGDEEENKLGELENFTSDDNKKYLTEEDDPEDIVNIKGQTGPINFSFQKENETVIVDFEELIRISGYTFRPIIRGKECYVKWQEDLIYNNKDPFIVILGSRQGGKSHVMGIRALLSTFKGYRRDILVCAFQTEATGHIQKYITRLMENYPEGVFVENKKKNWITNTLTGSRIIFRSLSQDAARIRGWTLHEIIMDECFLVSDDVFEDVLMPTLSTTGGSICMLSTPGTKNWFFWEVMKAKQKEPGYAFYSFTIDENPFVTDEFRERIQKRKNDPSIRREWYCEFDDGSNAVFRPTSTSELSFYLEHKDEAFYILAYDPARQGKDRAGYTCFMVYGGKVFVLKSGFIPDAYKGKWETQYEWFEKNIFNDGNNWHMVIDVTGAGNGCIAIFQQKRKIEMAIQYSVGLIEVEDDRRPYGGSTIAMRVGKSTLINNAQDFLDNGITTFYKFTNEDLFNEMAAIVELRSGVGLSGFTTKGFDDITNSCMIGLYYIKQRNLLNKKIEDIPKRERTLSDEPYFQNARKTTPELNGSHW